MVIFNLFVAFLWSVNIFSRVPVQAQNISDILDEPNENISHPLALNSEKTHLLGLKNESFYEQKCDCGFGSRGCRYEMWGKVCDCIYGYVQNNDRCESCSCGIFTSECTFVSNKKVCSCYGKYLQNNNDQCAECDCGPDAERCHFSGSSKVCTCRDGYISKYGKCEECDCGPKGIGCDLTSDKYTRCTCSYGYVAERSRWQMDEKCKLPGVNGWKIATYIEAVFFALILIACSIIICSKRVSE